MFLRLNGWPLKIRNEGASQARLAYGELSQDTFAGRPLRARKGLVDEYDVEGLFATAGNADTLSALLEGRGHHVGFDGDAFSDDGIGPESGSSYSIVPRVFGTSLPTGVHGTHYLSIPSSSYCVWDFGIPDDSWTVMWFRNLDFPLPQHVVVRSDGAKWIDGVRNDGASSVELLVGSGAVQFNATASAQQIDDLVVLPFVASQSFIESFYRWTRPLDMDVQLGSDLDNVDRSRRRASPTGSVTSTSSLIVEDNAPTGKGLRFVPSGASLQYVNDGSSMYLFSNSSTIEFWIRPERNGSGYVLYRGDGLGTFSWFVYLNENTYGLGDFSLLFALETTGGGISLITNVGRLVADEWNHVAFIVEVGTVPTARCYTNGEEDSFQLTVPPGPVFFSIDTGRTLTVGNDYSLSLGFNGSLSGLRKHSVALTQDEIAEIIETARLYGVRHPAGDRPFSSLPAVELFGGLTNGKPVQALCEVTAEPILPLRIPDASSWKSNVRTFNAVFRQRKIAETTRDFAPELLFRFQELSSEGASFFEQSKRIPIGAVGLPYAYEPGPFGKGRAQVFDGTSSDYYTIDAASDFHRVFAGSRYLSGVAWIRLPASAPAAAIYLAHIINSIPQTQLQWRVNNTGQVAALIRPWPSDSFLGFTTTAALTFDAGWHMLGLSIDVETDAVAISIDGAGISGGSYQSFVASWTNTRFTPANNLSYIGRLDSGGGWLGSISTIAFFDRFLSALDYHYFWSNAQRGLLIEESKK